MVPPPSSSLGVTTTTITTKKRMPVVIDPIVGVPLNPHYSIGTFLGEGAFGKVYTVIHQSHHRDDDTDGTTAWAVKVVPNHTSSSSSSLAVGNNQTTTTKQKKKKNHTSTPSDRLHYEHLMYTTQLQPLCGTIIPKLPNKHTHQLHSFYPSIRSDNHNNKTKFTDQTHPPLLPRFLTIQLELFSPARTTSMLRSSTTPRPAGRVVILLHRVHWKIQ